MAWVGSAEIKGLVQSTCSWYSQATKATNNRFAEGFCQVFTLNCSWQFWPPNTGLKPLKTLKTCHWNSLCPSLQGLLSSLHWSSWQLGPQHRMKNLSKLWKLGHTEFLGPSLQEFLSSFLTDLFLTVLGPPNTGWKNLSKLWKLGICITFNLNNHNF